MGRVSRTIVGITVVCVLITGAWVYTKYLRPDVSEDILATVTRMDLTELVTEQAELVSDAEYTLGFSIPGRVATVFVKEGDIVDAGAPLMALDTAELEFERRRLEAVRAAREAALSKLLAGLTREERAVLEAERMRRDTALADAETAERLSIQSAYTALDTAVRGTDIFFSNPTSGAPLLSFEVADSDLKNRVLASRVQLGVVLSDARARAQALADTTPEGAATRMLDDARRVSAYLDECYRALGSAVSSSVPQVTLDAWRTSVAVSRAAVNEASTALALASAARSGADEALKLAEKEWSAKTAPARAEDIAAARAAIREAENAALGMGEKIRAATIRAPQLGTVTHVEHRVGESYQVGERAVALTSRTPHLESEISELDIARIQTGMPATARFDALPGVTVSGIVTFIDPQRIEKDDDTFYVVHVVLSNASSALRPGMTADLKIRVSDKPAVLTVPEYAPFQREGVWYVFRRDAAGTQETQVELGITDGERREIRAGLSEGDTVVVPSE